MRVGSSQNISCMGIIGDGCGAGREFKVENETLIAHDPYTKENITLLENIHGAISISKHRCILTIVCKNENIKFDLSLLEKV